jgi:hypothetical protein
MHEPYGGVSHGLWLITKTHCYVLSLHANFDSGMYTSRAACTPAAAAAAAAAAAL